MAARSMVIGLGVTGLSGAVTQANKLADAMERVAKAAASVSMPGGGGSGGGGGAGGARRGFLKGDFQKLQEAYVNYFKALRTGTTAELQDAIAILTAAKARIAKRTATPAAKFGSGPFQQMQAELDNLRKAVAGGDPNAIADAKLRVAKAQMAVQRAQKFMKGGPDFWDRFSVWLRTIRFGGGGGVMPLVGRTLDLFGLGGGKGAVIAEAFAVVGFAVTKLAQDVGQLGRAATESGASMGEVARLTAMGIHPGQVAGAAGAFQQNLATNPMAMAAAAKLGVPWTPPRPFGNVDEAKNLLKALDALRKITNAEEQLRLARMLGVEALLDLIRVSDEVRNSQKRLAAAQEQIVDPTATQNARDFNAQVGTLGGALKLLGIAIIKPFLPLLTFITGALTSGIQGLAVTLDGLLNKITVFGTAIVSPVKLFIIGLWGIMEAVRVIITAIIQSLTDGHWVENFNKAGNTFMDDFAANFGDMVDPFKNAVNDFGKATGDFGAAVGAGMHGGGVRSAGALPSALKGYAFQRAVEGSALRLGAFTL